MLGINASCKRGDPKLRTRHLQAMLDEGKVKNKTEFGTPSRPVPVEKHSDTQASLVISSAGPDLKYE